MSRITITLEDSLHRALKETAARQGRSITKIIEESLVLRGIKPVESARELVARARSRSTLSEGEATDLARPDGIGGEEHVVSRVRA
uniref:Ribbon-helix-helix protein, CopG family n=2 Tax=Aromatoleum anaerobium TaxID=182180 RepID=A0ABX1PLY6_9RHOO